MVGMHETDRMFKALMNRRRQAEISQLIIDRKFLATLNFTPAQVQVYQDRIADIETRFSRLRAGRKK